MQDSEEDGEEMTDEQMFQRDNLLAAHLRLLKDAKSSAKNTKQVNVPIFQPSNISCTSEYEIRIERRGERKKPAHPWSCYTC